MFLALCSLLLCAQPLLAQDKIASDASTESTWLLSLDEAQTAAEASNKSILLVFSGSDWCGPCIKLKKSVLSGDAFQTFANDNVVLLLADFPRRKKNKLSSEQQSLNDALAERFNPEGQFPLTVLLDASGQKLASWSGTFEGDFKVFEEKALAALPKM